MPLSVAAASLVVLGLVLIAGWMIVVSLGPKHVR